MLRRSLSVLVLLPVLGLAIILVYAIWNRRATTTTLVEAERLLAAGATREAIGLLYHADRSLGPRGDPDQRRKLLLLRYRANQDIGNHTQALRDLSILLGEFAWSDAEARRSLALDKVRLLLEEAIESDPAKLGAALQESLECLAHHPEDASALELAGLCEQAVYERDLATLLADDLPTKLAGTTRQLVRRSLPRILFRPASDPLAVRLRQEMSVELRRDVDTTTADRLAKRVEVIHGRIQASIAYYRQALMASEPAWDALRSYLAMLLHGDRLDEAALLSWLYQLRWPKHQRAAVAVAARVEVWLRLGQPKRALEAVDSWLAGRRLAQVIEAQPFTPALMDLLLNYARAAHTLGRADLLGDLSQSIYRYEKLAPALRFDIYYARALYSDLAGNKDVEWFLSEYCRQSGTRRPPASGEDLHATALQIRLRWARKLGERQLERRILDDWVRDRPTDPLPLIHRCEFYLGHNEATAAAKDAELAIDLRDPPELRERALDLLLKARELQHARAGQRDTAAQMLQQLRAQGLELPLTIPDPVLHIGIAQRALEQGLASIAVANLRNAAERFAWSRQVRVMSARALLELGRLDDVLREVREVLAKDPGDLEALELEYKVESRRGGRLSAASRVEFLRGHPARQEAVFGLLDHLVARSAHDLALQLVERHRETLAGLPAARLLEARAHLGKLAFAPALAALDAVPAEAPEYPEAAALAVEAAAMLGDAPRLSQLVKRLTRCETTTGDALLRVAATLTDRGYVSEALEVLRPIETATDADRQQWRNGRFFTLLGRLRHADGRDSEAQEQWNAAFSFEDGEEAAPLLAISHLLRNDEPAARDMLRYVAEPTGDPLLLAWLHQALGDGKRALAVLKRSETKSPLLRTLLTQSLETVLEPARPPSAPTFDPFLNAIVKTHAKLVFDSLALAPGLAFTGAASRAHAALVAAFPKADAGTTAALRTLGAFQDLLAGRELKAAKALLAVTHDVPFYYAAYDPLITLSERLAPETLVQRDMIIRYMGLMSLGPDKLYEHGSHVPAMLFRGLALAARQHGNFDGAAIFLRLAHGLDSSDTSVLTLMAEDAGRRGDLDAALELHAAILGRQGDAGSSAAVNSACEMALSALARPEAKQPDSTLGQRVRDILARALRYQETAGDRTRPPLGSVALLDLRLRQLTAGGQPSPEHVALLERFLEPYVLGRVPADADLDGVQRVLDELAERGQRPAVIDKLRLLIERDPSLLELWVQRARHLEAHGDSEAAVADLAWFAPMLPHAPALAMLGRLLGIHPTIRPDLRAPALAAIEGCGVDSPELRAGRAFLELRLGRLEEAFANFSAAAAIRLDPAETWLRDATLLAVEPDGPRGDILARMRALASDPERCPYPATTDIVAQLEILERATGK